MSKTFKIIIATIIFVISFFSSGYIFLAGLMGCYWGGSWVGGCNIIEKYLVYICLGVGIFFIPWLVIMYKKYIEKDQGRYLLFLSVPTLMWISLVILNQLNLISL